MDYVKCSICNDIGGTLIKIEVETLKCYIHSECLTSMGFKGLTWPQVVDKLKGTSNGKVLFS